MSPSAWPACACSTSVGAGDREVSGTSRSLMKRVAEPVQRLKKGIPLPRPRPCSTCYSGGRLTSLRNLKPRIMHDLFKVVIALLALGNAGPV